MSSWTAASSDCSRPMNNYVHVITADLYRPNARLTPERQGYQVLTPFGKLGYSQENTSLGCLRTATPPSLTISRWGKVRARVADGTFDVDLSVTDLQLYGTDQTTPRANVIADVQRRIQRGVGVILSVGLARAFRVSGDTARRHWLQVNNLYLEDDPAWKAD